PGRGRTGRPHIAKVCAALDQQAAIGNQQRFDDMKAFFGQTGQGDAAGVWSATPQPRPEFKAEVRRQLDKQARRRKAEEMGS
ncbi:MAG: chlorophyllide reductase subunit Y, partial [Limnohabitans sp.]